MIDWKKFFASFLFAFQGIKTTIKNEQNFKLHLLAAFLVLTAAILLHFSTIRMVILLIVIGNVLALELLNTAIENAVDLITKERHPLAKKAKDAGAGAVLVFSIISCIIGILLFAEPIINSLKH